jgi:RES domain-containing protein
VKVYRLSKQIYADDLTGAGAELAGGRWNHKGTRMLYTSDSRALCTAEIAVHTPMGVMPKDYFLVTIEIPDRIRIGEIALKDLSENWKDFPYTGITQEIGDEFIRQGELLVLKVPSAVVPGDFNYLINPEHKNFNKIKIKNKEPFSFDERLFR